MNETKLTELRTIHKEDDGGIASGAVKITMKQVFFLSTLQMLSCCQHISNFKFFSRKILTTINAHCLQAMHIIALQEAANSQLCACVKLQIQFCKKLENL